MSPPNLTLGQGRSCDLRGVGGKSLVLKVGTASQASDLLCSCADDSEEGWQTEAHRPNLVYHLFSYGPGRENEFAIFKWLKINPKGILLSIHISVSLMSSC